MNLIQCIDCKRLCFTDFISCPSCGRAFQEGEMAAKAFAENKSFQMKSSAMFLTAFVVLLSALFYVAIQGY